MAERAEVRIVIKPDGTVHVETSGLTGETCLEETKDMEQALGKVTKRTKTRDYHAAKTATKTTIRGR